MLIALCFSTRAPMEESFYTLVFENRGNLVCEFGHAVGINARITGRVHGFGYLDGYANSVIDPTLNEGMVGWTPEEMAMLMQELTIMKSDLVEEYDNFTIRSEIEYDEIALTEFERLGRRYNVQFHRNIRGSCILMIGRIINIGGINYQVVLISRLNEDFYEFCSFDVTRYFRIHRATVGS